MIVINEQLMHVLTYIDFTNGIIPQVVSGISFLVCCSNISTHTKDFTSS